MTETASKGGLMAGRRGLIMGVANERSIAWSVASALAREGAQLAFTYQVFDNFYQILFSLFRHSKDVWNIDRL